jgi:phosphoenolpyruvate carboxykinase (ATP)
VPGVESSLLDPRTTWADASVYDVKARELARLFRENFEGFAGDAGTAVTAAGPRV